MPHFHPSGSRFPGNSLHIANPAGSHDPLGSRLARTPEPSGFTVSRAALATGALVLWCAGRWPWCAGAGAARPLAPWMRGFWPMGAGEVRDPRVTAAVASQTKFLFFQNPMTQLPSGFSNFSEFIAPRRISMYTHTHYGTRHPFPRRHCCHK